MPAMPCVSLECGAKGKLSTKQAIDGIYAEAQRRPMPSGLKYTERVDPQRSKQNITWQNSRWKRENNPVPDYEKAIKTLMNERSKGKRRTKIRKDAVLVRSMIYQVSPSHFFPEIRDWSQSQIDLSTYSERGKIDMYKVKTWKDAMHEFLKKKYGDNLLSWQLHLDETSPHLHVQIVPVTDDGRLSSKDMFNPVEIKKHLDEVAEACQPLGITRAREGGDIEHIRRDPHEWSTFAAKERQYQAEKGKERTILDEFPKELNLPPKPEKPEPPKKPGLFASKEEKEEYQKELQDYEYDLERWKEETDPRVRNRQQKKLILDRLNNDSFIIKAQKKELQETKEELEKTRHELKKEWKKQEAARFKAIPLPDIIELMYPDIIQDKRDSSIWRIENRKIGIAKDGRFIDNYDPKFKGKGAIDFIMAMDGCGVKEAIGKIRDYFGTDEAFQHVAIEESKVFTQIIDDMPSQTEPKPPARDEKNLHNLAKWLKNDLKISEETIDYLINEKGLIYPDNRCNCIVPRLNGGCFARGTVKLANGEKNRFKKTTGSKKAGVGAIWGKNATGQSPVILTEGITDALALVDMNPNAVVFIIGGNLYPDLPDFLTDPILAFDTDEAGKRHLAYYLNLYPNAEVMTPSYGLDWSEMHIREVEESEEEDDRFPRPSFY